MTVNEKLDSILEKCGNNSISIEEKEALANAITNKGVDTNVSDSLSVMTENINKIDTHEVVNFTGVLGSYDGQSSGIPSYTIIPTLNKKNVS